MDSGHGIHVLTLANSIIGVSILAMPYCFKQCGIILSILLLLISSVISRLTCHFLLKSAIKARLRTFEYLAYHALGTYGKLFVEIGLIGFLLGTCIAFFVVMGDLGPQIITEWTDLQYTSALRTGILCVLAFVCVLPLGLLRNIGSMSGVSTVTICFYFCLVLKIVAEAGPHILMNDWYPHVNFWRPQGLLQCLPIFSMALFCQTQLFEIYQAIPNASLEKMNEVVKVAVNSCTCVYIFVGIFGYIALAKDGDFSGNILLSFKPSIITEIMKIGFVLSVAFSFPLVIFPCRASIYSLLYKHTYTSLHEAAVTYIPETKFRLITLLIVSLSLVIGILIPNIELVLGLVGSTIGVMICVLFPSTCFIIITQKNTNERILAQIMLFVGILVMVLGTYANLYAIEQVTYLPEKEAAVVPVTEKLLIVPKEEVKIIEKVVEPVLENKEVRHEPPQPEAPPEDKKVEEKVAAPEAPIVVIPETFNKVEPAPDLVKPTPVIIEPPTEKVVAVPAKIEIDAEAIKLKEKEELQNVEEKDKLLDFQRKVAEEQLKLKEEMKKDKVEAVKTIEKLAKQAIESIVNDESKSAGAAKINITNISKNDTKPVSNLMEVLNIPVINKTENEPAIKIDVNVKNVLAKDEPKNEIRRKRQIEGDNCDKKVEALDAK